MEATRQYLEPLVFASGFTSRQLQGQADALWQGRSVPPLFLRMRVRDALDGCEPEALWRELLTQNWELGLDHGLQGRKAGNFEALLVVASAECSATLLGFLGINCEPLPAEGDLLCIGLQGGPQPPGSEEGPLRLNSLGVSLELAPFKPGLGQRTALRQFD